MESNSMEGYKMKHSASFATVIQRLFYINMQKIATGSLFNHVRQYVLLPLNKLDIATIIQIKIVGGVPKKLTHKKWVSYVTYFLNCKVPSEFWHERSALQSVAVQAVDWQRR